MVRRGAVVDRDDLELAETGHVDRLGGAGLPGETGITAAMHMDQQPVAIFGRNRLGRHDIGLDAIDRGRLDLDAELLAQSR
jgi:hypothetical protein